MLRLTFGLIAIVLIKEERESQALQRMCEAVRRKEFENSRNVAFWICYISQNESGERRCGALGEQAIEDYVHWTPDLDCV